MKSCRTCDESKPLDEFYKRSSGSRFRDCKACVLTSRRARYEQDGATLRARVARYQAENPDVVRACRRRYDESSKRTAATRRAYLKREYGITPAQFDAMLVSQGGACAICRETDPGKTWCVDHDHLSGAVRGILCWHCNVGLGHFRDDALALLAAVEYLYPSPVARTA